MIDSYPRILQVSFADISGGAEKIAWNLFTSYRDLKYQSWLVVGTKRSCDPDVFSIGNGSQRFTQINSRFNKRRYSAYLVESIKNRMGLARKVAYIIGHEFFEYPRTWDILNLTPEPPNILHCHNLHGRYFDLRALPWLSHQIPTILSLHDAWLISGHCAHSFMCERWKTGCGKCPDLSIYPAIFRDATSFNWRRKKKIFSRSRFFISTPSKWLMDKVEQSILAPSCIEKRVIPNGIDLTIFRPRDRLEARAELRLPANAQIVLFAANGIRANIWKDYRTMQDAIGIAAGNIQNSKIYFVALGENAPDERIGAAVIHFVPHQRDPQIVARYFQAADVYIHAAKADTFPNTVLEALACGIPVVATDVGGIPEQVRNGETGFLTPIGDAMAMSAAIQRLLDDPDLRDKMGKAGVDDVRLRFSLELQVSRFLDWYEEILVDLR